jgi:hypothetical protein
MGKLGQTRTHRQRAGARLNKRECHVITRMLNNQKMLISDRLQPQRKPAPSPELGQQMFS